MGYRFQKLPNPGIVAMFHQKLGPMSLPHHLLQIRQIPLVDPNPDVRLLETETCCEILHVEKISHATKQTSSGYGGLRASVTMPYCTAQQCVM